MCLCAQLRRQRGKRARLPVFTLSAQQPQTGTGHDVQGVAVLSAGKRVVTTTQQHEIVCRQPLQEVARLCSLFRLDRSWRAQQAGDDVVHALTHQAPVADRRAHIGQHLLETLLQGLQIGLIATTVDLEVHGRFILRVGIAVVCQAQQHAVGVAHDLEYRMDQQV